jgi:hypothetical protein
MITVTGLSLLDFDGTPLSGVILFTPSEPLYLAGTAVLEGSATMVVTAGVGTPISIPCTDNVIPNFTYTITQRLTVSDVTGPPPVTGVAVPHSLGSSVDVSALL